MIFDPDAGRSIEEIILDAWEHKVSAERKARIHARARARGWSWWDVVMEDLSQLTTRLLEDPLAQQQFMMDMKRRELPFGPDPRLSQADNP